LTPAFDHPVTSAGVEAFEEHLEVDQP